MEILTNNKNDLLNRPEIKLTLESEKSPSYSELALMDSEEIAKPVENVDILSVYGSFGSNLFEASVYVYDSEDDKNRIKRKTKKQRDADKKALEEAKKAEEEAKKNAETSAVEETSTE